MASDEKAVQTWAGADIEMAEGRGLQLTTMGEAWEFARAVKKAGISNQSEGEILVSMQTGAELGFSPMRSLQACPVVRKRMFLEGKAGLALVKSKDVYDQRLSSPEIGHRAPAKDELVGYCKSWRKGWDQPRETTFSMKQARMAKLVKKDSAWETYPDRMVMWRAVGFHLDEYYSDVTHGLPLSQNMDGYSVKVEPVKVASQEPGTSAPDKLLDGLVEPEVVTPEVVDESQEASEGPAEGEDPDVIEGAVSGSEEIAPDLAPYPPLASAETGGEVCGAPGCARVPHPAIVPHMSDGGHEGIAYGEEFHLVGEPGYVEESSSDDSAF